jgi:hypothetical protein
MIASYRSAASVSCPSFDALHAVNSPLLVIIE